MYIYQTVILKTNISNSKFLINYKRHPINCFQNDLHCFILFTILENMYIIKNKQETEKYKINQDL